MAMICATPVIASDFLQLNSCQFNSNEILSHTNVPNSTPRTILNNVINSLKSKRKYNINGDEFISGLMYPYSQGSQFIGEPEDSITHPGQ